MQLKGFFIHKNTPLFQNDCYEFFVRRPRCVVRHTAVMALSTKVS